MAVILKWKHGLLSVFSISFAIFFLAVWDEGFAFPLINNSSQNLVASALGLALLSVIVLLFFLALYHWMGGLSPMVIRRISLALMAVMSFFEIWLIFAFHTLVPPAIDGGHTFAEAQYLLIHHHASGLPYFQIYPNNIPVTLLRYFIYQAFSWVHFSSYMVIDWTFCTAMLDLGIFFGWKLLRRLTGERGGCFFLLLVLTCLPLFFYTLYFYTDTAIIAFPVLLLYCWYQYHQSGKMRYLLVLGLLLGIGFLIRPNLILFLPALVIYMFFVLNWKKVILISLLISVLVGLISFSAIPLERHYGYIPNPALQTPSVHWIMLGLSSFGSYNPADMQRTLSQPTQAAKRQADLQQIRSRIRTDGLTGLARLAAIKAAVTWSSGAHGYYIYTHLNTHPTTAYEYLLNNSRNLVLLIIQVFYMVNLFLLICSVLHYFRTRKPDLNLLVQICLFGNFLFYTFVWEAEPRYSLLFSPFILISDIYGLRALSHLIHRFAAMPGSPAHSRVVRLMPSATLAAALLIAAAAGYHPLVQAKANQFQYSVHQPYAVGSASAHVDAAHTVVQTFRSAGNFNRITINLNRAAGHAVYSVKLVNRDTGRIVYSRNFSADRLNKPRPITFPVSGIADTPLPYRLTLAQISGQPGSDLALQKSGFGTEQRDLYPGGQLIQGAGNKKQDLTFEVYRIYRGPYLHTRVYMILIAVPLLMLLFSASVSLRRRDRDVAGNKQDLHPAEQHA